MSIEVSYEMFGSKQCCAPGLPQQVCTQTSASSSPSTVWLKRSTRKSSVVLRPRPRPRSCGSRAPRSGSPCSRRRRAAQLGVEDRRDVPHQLALVLVVRVRLDREHGRRRGRRRSSRTSPACRCGTARRARSSRTRAGRAGRPCRRSRGTSSRRRSRSATSRPDSPAGGRLGVELGDAAQPLGRIREPRPAGEVEVEVVVAVREDVEAGELLVADHGCDRVDVLLPERRRRPSPSSTAARAGSPCTSSAAATTRSRSSAGSGPWSRSAHAPFLAQWMASWP